MLLIGCALLCYVLDAQLFLHSDLGPHRKSTVSIIKTFFFGLSRHLTRNTVFSQPLCQTWKSWSDVTVNRWQLGCESVTQSVTQSHQVYYIRCIRKYVFQVTEICCVFLICPMHIRFSPSRFGHPNKGRSQECSQVLNLRSISYNASSCTVKSCWHCKNMLH